jgi:hypothetical protein
MTRPKEEEEEEEQEQDMLCDWSASSTHRVAVFPFWRSRKTETWARRHKYCHRAQSLRRREPSCRPSCTACPSYSGIHSRAKTWWTSLSLVWSAIYNQQRKKLGLDLRVGWAIGSRSVSAIYLTRQSVSLDDSLVMTNDGSLFITHSFPSGLRA